MKNVLKKVFAFGLFLTIILTLNAGIKKAYASDFSVYYEHVDPYYYDADGWHVKVKIVNADEEIHQYKIRWFLSYEDWEDDDKWDDIVIPRSDYYGKVGYYGTETLDFAYYPGMGGKSFDSDFYWFCAVQDEDGVIHKTDRITMPEALKAKKIEWVNFQVDGPVLGGKFDNTAESDYPEQYNADGKVQWYKVNSETGEEERITKDTIATAGKYTSRIYVDTVEGYGIELDGTLGKTGNKYGLIFYDPDRNQFYLKSWFYLNDTVEITYQSEGVRAYNGGIKAVSVIAENAKEYQWQKLSNGVYVDIVSGEGYSGFKGNRLQINSMSIVNNKVRCKVTGYDDTVVYSNPVKCLTCEQIELTPSSSFENEGDELEISYKIPSSFGMVASYKWYFKLDQMPTWKECSDYPEYFSDMSENKLTINSIHADLIESNCQIKCAITYNDNLGNLETKTATIYPYRAMLNFGDNYVLIEGGEFQYGLQDYKGETYFFGTAEDPFMKTSWQHIGKNWYYFQESGIMYKNDWLHLEDKWYYLDKDGIMAVGWKNIKGKWYYFDKNGVMQTGWLNIDDKTYYLDENGVMVTGDIALNGITYHFGSDGALIMNAQKLNQWEKIDNKWYYYGSDGKLSTGWKNIGNKWFYFEANGVMATGWKKVGTKWYYLEASGVMATGWKKVGTKWYYLEASGVMATGWKKLGDKWYYLKSNGVMAASEAVTISGKTYNFDAKGVWISK